MGSWLVVAAAHGMQPDKDECLGWRLHPLIGGPLEVANPSLMGQLHRQARMIGPSTRFELKR